ncbi:unnamed protein product [Tenebrio molitor]|nr:unnamed protein product [Tenebrio molitor]
MAGKWPKTEHPRPKPDVWFVRNKLVSFGLLEASLSRH